MATSRLNSEEFVNLVNGLKGVILVYKSTDRDGNEKEKHKLESKTTKEVPDAAQAEAPASGKPESDRETTSCLVRASQKRRITDGLCPCP